MILLRSLRLNPVDDLVGFLIDMTSDGVEVPKSPPFNVLDGDDGEGGELDSDVIGEFCVVEPREPLRNEENTPCFICVGLALLDSGAGASMESVFDRRNNDLNDLEADRKCDERRCGGESPFVVCSPNFGREGVEGGVASVLMIRGFWKAVWRRLLEPL